MKGRIVICDYCGTPADFVDSSVVYHGHSFGMIYLCPRCGAYVGVHKGSDKPLGRLANSELRNWKKAAHAAFDPLWKYGPYRGRRNEAYRWLSEKMGTPIEFTHIGMFDVASAARWSASCEKKGTNYGKRNCFEQPYPDDFHFC